MSKFLANAVQQAIAGAALSVLTSANANPAVGTHVPVQERQEIAREISAAAQASPEIRHLTSTETSPWQSRAHWSMIASIIGPAVGLAGLKLAPEYLEGVATVGWLLCSAWAAYAAYRARKATKPLGA